MARAYGDALYGDCFYGGADVVQSYFEGRVRYPTPAVPTNLLSMALTTFPVDSSAEIRTDHVRPPAANFVGMCANPIYFRYAATSVAAILLDSGLTFPTASALYSALVGFPAVGERIQTKQVWDPAGNLLSWFWRPGGLGAPDLLSDVVPFTLGASLGSAVQMHTLGQFSLNETAVNTQAVGDAFRWTLKLNGTLVADVNAPVDVTGDTATLIPSVGNTVSIVRTGSPDVELMPTVDMVCSSQARQLPCPDQQPDASGPADRLVGAVPCPEGDC